LGRSHIHWGETGYQDVIVEVSYDDLAALALANGYVKLEPGTIQIKIEDAETLTEWFNDMVPPPWITQACERVRAALEVEP
jgi:hypothetical protein